jgi:hypothetical protein
VFETFRKIVDDENWNLYYQFNREDERRRPMSEFKTLLIARLLPECPGTEQWQLVAPLVYQSDLLGTITVPADFITDFVSMKALNYTAHRPAVIHDYLYSKPSVTREDADNVLKEALGVIGVNPLLIEEMYFAVRAFGASHKTT